MDNKNLNQFEKKINVIFNDKDLLQQVFVHRSYLNEHKSFPLDNNERLEFLGDACLELVVTEYLYKKYQEPEGVLTNWRSALVKGESLSELAKKIGIDNYLMLSRGESQGQGKSRNLILANAMEALIGAIYLDQGYDKVAKFINDYLIINLDNIIENELFIDAKSKLQEFSQEKYKITPIYKVISESGPDHAKKFVTGVFIGDKQIGEGDGNSKQKAEQDAANNALNNVNDIKNFSIE